MSKINLYPTLYICTFLIGILGLILLFRYENNRRQEIYATCIPYKTVFYYTDALTNQLMVVCADNTIRKMK